METKYGFNFNQEEVNKEIVRLTNQLWKLIPMRENNESPHLYSICLIL